MVKIVFHQSILAGHRVYLEHHLFAVRFVLILKFVLMSNRKNSELGKHVSLFHLNVTIENGTLLAACDCSR